MSGGNPNLIVPDSWRRFSRKAQTHWRGRELWPLCSASAGLRGQDGRSIGRPYTTWVRVPREQPVPFSHKHHVDGLGIDCRYCHTSVETSHYAGMPPTETCMTCHSQLWTQAALLEPVRQSLATGMPIQWNRVNDLPDFVYFDHSIHVNKGIGCATCHGQVDQMPLTWKENTLYMKWCLECHRAPENEIRPRGEVFNMKWQKPENQAAAGGAS